MAFQEVEQKPSPLQRWPAELRNKIYELAFTGKVVRVGSPRSRSHHRTPPGLLLACKQTYAEASNMYYDLSSSEATSVPYLAIWLRELPQARIEQLKDVLLVREEWFLRKDVELNATSIADHEYVKLAESNAERIFVKIVAMLEVQGVELKDGVLRLGGR